MTAPQSPPGGVTRPAIVAAARAWLGTPYLHQASAKGAGCDCLGLIRGLWRELYGYEPEAPPAYTPDWNERAFARAREPLLEAARRHLIERDQGAYAKAITPGDVVVFRVLQEGPAKHCGVVSGPGRFIHAYAGRSVVETSMGRWWRTRLAGVFEFPGVE